MFHRGAKNIIICFAWIFTKSCTYIISFQKKERQRLTLVFRKDNAECSAFQTE